MKKVMIVVLAMSLSACSAVDKVMDKAADVNDEALNSAEFTICNGASVGAVERRYNSAELMDARKTLCQRQFLEAE